MIVDGFSNNQFKHICIFMQYLKSFNLDFNILKEIKRNLILSTKNYHLKML